MRVVLLLIVAGAVLRVLAMRWPVMHEEAMACTGFAARSWQTVFSDLGHPSNNVFHTVLMRLSMQVFGTHLWSIRLPALAAGILVMPLFYVFVRSMFNRYIALIALGFVAGSGCLVEYSAIGQGYSLSWLGYLSALLLGRHLARTNNLVSAVLLGLASALAMWSVPTALFSVIAVYLWVFVQLSVKYRGSLNRRLMMLFFSAVLAFGAALLLYMPAISRHGLLTLFHPLVEGGHRWSGFLNTHQDRAFDLWAWINDTASTWLSFLGFVGLLFAVYISSKFRVLVVTLVLGAIPFVTLLFRVGDPWEWAYVLFVLHLSSGIALFYLLKLVQEQLLPGLAKRLRTVVSALVMFALFGTLGMRAIADRIERFPEAAYATAWFGGILKPGVSVLVEYPWEAPLAFHMRAARMDTGPLSAEPGQATGVYVLVGPADGQTLPGVLAHFPDAHLEPADLKKVQDWRRLEIYVRR